MVGFGMKHAIFKALGRDWRKTSKKQLKKGLLFIVRQRKKLNVY